MLVFLSLALLELKGQWKVMRLSDFSLDLRFLGGLYLRVNSGGTLKISLTQTLKHDLRNARPQRGHIHNTVLFITSRTFRKSRGQPFHVSAVPGSQGARLSFFLSPSPPLWVFFPHSLSFLLFFSFNFFFLLFFFLSSAFPPGEEKRFCKCCQLRWSR